jgi:hypothetical protein
MRDTKLPKFKWGKTFDNNSGHNRDEWGKTKNEEEREE